MNVRDTLKNALRVLDEVALDLVNTQLAEYRQMYRGGYKPHRVAQAEAEVKAVEDTIRDLRMAVAATDLPDCVADAVQELKRLADNWAWAQGGGDALRGDHLARMTLFAALDSFAVRLDSPPIACTTCGCGDTDGVTEAFGPGVTLTGEDAHFLAVRLRRLCAHHGYTLPKFAEDDAALINIAGSVIGALLTNATAGVIPSEAPSKGGA